MEETMTTNTITMKICSHRKGQGAYFPMLGITVVASIEKLSNLREISSLRVEDKR
jgi:hypothetical protein